MNGPNDLQRSSGVDALALLFALCGEVRYIGGMADAFGKLRGFRLAPYHCLATLLAVEGLLWLSNRLGWPAWHKGYAVLAAVAAVAAMMLLMLLWFAPLSSSAGDSSSASARSWC